MVKDWKTIWLTDDLEIKVIDQTVLPHEFKIKTMKNIKDVFLWDKNMTVRGAPLIGVTGGYGLALAIKEDSSDKNLINCSNFLKSARPTAVNLSWAIDRIYNKVARIEKDVRDLVLLLKRQKLLN